MIEAFLYHYLMVQSRVVIRCTLLQCHGKPRLICMSAHLPVRTSLSPLCLTSGSLYGCAEQDIPFSSGNSQDIIKCWAGQRGLVCWCLMEPASQSSGKSLQFVVYTVFPMRRRAWDCDGWREVLFLLLDGSHEETSLRL